MHTIVVALVVGVATSLVANLATTIYLHRALAHRALVLRPPAAQFFRFVIWVTTGIRPRQWVAVHRKHHAFTDVEGDPHSPVLHGWLTVQMKNVSMYRAEARNPRTIDRYAKDIPQTWADRVFYDHALLGLGLGITTLVALFGWKIGLLAAFVHVNVYLAGSAAVTPSATTSAAAPTTTAPATCSGWPSSPPVRACTTTTTPPPRRRSSRTAGSRSIRRGT